MHKLTQIGLLAIFSLTTTQFSYAYDGAGNPSNPPGQAAYSQDLYNQGPPNMQAEDEFIIQSRNRMNQMRESHSHLMSQDRNMMREGYDPNESYYGGQASNIQGPSSSYPSQEQMMRGEYQGGYSQSNTPTMPQTYPHYPDHSQNPTYPSTAPFPSQQKDTPPSPRTPQINTSPPSNHSLQVNQGYYEHQTYDHTMIGFEDSRQSVGRSNTPPSPRMNQGISNTDTNANWDTTDDQKMRESSANTIQSSRWNSPKL